MCRCVEGEEWCIEGGGGAGESVLCVEVGEGLECVCVEGGAGECVEVWRG